MKFRRPKRWVDYSLVCVGTLALLSAGGYAGERLISAHPLDSLFQTQQSAHSTEYIKGQNASRNDYNHHKFADTTSLLTSFLSHKSVVNQNFRQGYHHEFLVINNLHHVIPVATWYHIQPQVKKYLQTPNPLQQGGMLKGFKNNASDIPYVYQNDLHYAKGFLYGVHYSPSADSGEYNNIISNYHSYRSVKGGIPLQQVAGKDIAKVYQLCQKVTDNENKYAIAKPKQYEKHMYQKSRLSLEYRYLYHDTLASNVKVNTKFATGLFSKYPLHKQYFFPADVVNGRKNYLNGVILGKDDGIDANQTMNAYLKYMQNLYKNQPKSSITKKFSQNYTSHKVSQASGTGDYVCIYKIQFKHPKTHAQLLKSTIYYVMPQGNVGYIPRN